MTRRTTSGGLGLLAAATALTTWLALGSWGGFVQHNGSYLQPLVLSMGMVAGVGVAARSLRLPAVVVLCCQLLAVFVILNVGWGSRLLPTPSSLREVVRTFDTAVDAAQAWAAPVPESAPSIALILVAGGLLCHVLVDFCAVTLGKVPLAGLPLLTIYSLPISILDSPVNSGVFVLAAGGFLMMLALQESDRVMRWGRPLRASQESDLAYFGVGTSRRTSMAVGASAITMALVVPLLIPTLDLELFGGRGAGTGSGDRKVRVTNPMADLRKDLVRGADVPLVNVTTTDLDPSYLRLSVLTTFTGITWTPGGRDLPGDQAADGEMPTPTGLARSVPRTEVPWQLSITEDLESLWLPTPRYLKDINAGSQWRYDAETLDIHSADNDVYTSGMDYTLTALEPELTGEALAEAVPPPFEISSAYTRLPGDLPGIVSQLAEEVTAGQTTDYHRAVALQRWFWEEFEYSLKRASGNGSNELAEFLSPGGRIGYCEQFAAAMAVMARSLGIPARVAVGLLDADRLNTGPSNWEFSSHDMHAWPELYFSGFGWVLFEPTPQVRTRSVPGYTRGELQNDPGTAPTNGTATAQPSSGPPTRAPEDPAPGEQGSTDDEDSTFPFLPVLGGLGGLLLLAGLALVPQHLRRRRSVRRWDNAADPAEAAWWELRDFAHDLAIRWPVGLSPRAGAAVLARRFAAPTTPDAPERPALGPLTNPEAVESLGRIVQALELSRYAPAGQPVANLEEMRGCAETCVEALRAGVTPRARRRATWWPRSVLFGSARDPVMPTARVRPGQGVVDNLG